MVCVARGGWNVGEHQCAHGIVGVPLCTVCAVSLGIHLNNRRRDGSSFWHSERELRQACEPSDAGPRPVGCAGACGRGDSRRRASVEGRPSADGCSWKGPMSSASHGGSCLVSFGVPRLLYKQGLKSSAIMPIACRLREAPSRCPNTQSNGQARRLHLHRHMALHALHLMRNAYGLPTPCPGQINTSTRFNPPLPPPFRPPPSSFLFCPSTLLPERTSPPHYARPRPRFVTRSSRSWQAHGSTTPAEDTLSIRTSPHDSDASHL